MDRRDGTELPRPRLWHRILARLRGRSIDDRVLTGEATDGSEVTRARLARLLDRGYRAAIAKALRRLLDAARRHERNLFAAQILLRDDEVLSSELLIRTLAQELEQEDRVSPRGVILADRLITDGGSPVYWPLPLHHPPEQSVESAVKHARAALHLG
jgi:Arc/MetJ-type ribon-helix-helix transcriptional regulator